MSHSRFFTSILLAIVSVSGMAQAAQYDIDPDHSSVSFKVRHLVSRVKGTFDKFSGTISMDGDKLATLKTSATIEVGSINTNNEKRDKHLRSGDFFDAEKFAEMKFVSGKMEKVSSKTGKLHGDLTLHGVTKPVVLDVESMGEATDPWGNHKAGFSAKTTVSRKDFGISWNKTLDKGGLMIGDDVEVAIEIEATQKK